jgi:hypothetical protein
MLVEAKVVAMAQAFQIVSVSRSLTNWGHHHITAIDTAPMPGSPDSWPIASALGALGADIKDGLERLSLDEWKAEGSTPAAF